MYLTPWNLIPIAWVKTNEQMAKARVVFKLAVGELKPGIKPMRLDVRMKRKMVATYGKKNLPSGPVISTIKFSRLPSRTSKKFCPFFGRSWTPLANRRALTIRMSMTSHAWVTNVNLCAKCSSPTADKIESIKKIGCSIIYIASPDDVFKTARIPILMMLKTTIESPMAKPMGLTQPLVIRI
jgi:hypothetical protein